MLHHERVAPAGRVRDAVEPLAARVEHDERVGGRVGPTIAQPGRRVVIAYQGSEYVFTLVKALQHSWTPSLTPVPESFTPPKGVTSSR